MKLQQDITWKSNKLGSNSDDLLIRNNNKNKSTVDDEDIFLGVDRDAMFDPSIHLPHAPQDWKGYEPSTPLSDFLMQRIGVSGQPITTAEYMRHALTHPLYGYYTSSKSKSSKPSGNNDKQEMMMMMIGIKMIMTNHHQLLRKIILFLVVEVTS